MALLYSLFGNQVNIKLGMAGAPKTGPVKEQSAFIAERSVVNTMEQALPFLALMWLHAMFVNPRVSMVLGWVYVVTRALYPIFYGFYGEFTVLVEFVTWPNYSVIFYLLWAVAYKCISGSDFHTTMNSKSPWLMLISSILVICVGFTVAMSVLSLPSTMIILRGVKGKDEDPEEEEDEEEGVECQE